MLDSKKVSTSLKFKDMATLYQVINIYVLFEVGSHLSEC